MPHIDADLTHVVAAQSWNSGGGIELDIIKFDGGLTLVVSDELISVYPSAEAFWEETGSEGPDQRATMVLSRESGAPFVLR